jgi:flagellar protein FlgJ
MSLPALPAADPAMLADTGSLAPLQQAAAAHNPQALRQAAQQFESLFVGMVLKSMRQADFSDPLFGSDQASMYQDMYDDQIASEISKGRGLGLADMLVQQLRRSGLPGTTQGSSTAAAGSSSAITAAGGSAATRSAAASGGSPASGNARPTSGSSTATGISRAFPAADATSSTTSSSTAAAASTTAPSCPTGAQQLQFAQSLWPEAQRAARQLGVNPISLVAQAALETDWGRSMPRAAGGSSSNNLFGIKAGSAWSGASVLDATREYDSGTATRVKAQFRAYASPSQCFQDYVSLLQSNPRYAAALGTGDDTHAFATALQRGGYATDPGYAAKLGAVAGTLTRALKSASSLPTTSGSNTL